VNFREIVRFVTSLALVAIVGVVVPVFLAVTELLVLKPPTHDIAVGYVTSFGPFVTGAITLFVLLPLAIWRRAETWWDGAVYVLVAGAAYAALIVLFGARAYYDAWVYAGAASALLQALKLLLGGSNLIAYGAITGLLVFAIVRVFPPRE
jgi:hypothetical protein